MTNLEREAHAGIAVLGGGVAGLSCALWLKHLGHSPIVIERRRSLGGQLVEIDRVNPWVLGLPGRTGRELAATYAQHVLEEAIDVRLGVHPAAVDLNCCEFRITLRNDAGLMAPVLARAIVIATGVRVKTQEVLDAIPGADQLHASGLLSFLPLDHLDSGLAVEGKRVAVIGGGDNAHFTARDLAARAAVTYLLIRAQPDAQSGIRIEVESLIRLGSVQERRQVALAEIRSGPTGIDIALARNDAVVESLEVDRIFFRTGFAPNTEFLAALGPLARLRMDADGYLSIDRSKRASVPRVYAVGDVANPENPAVVAAIADGALAARTIARDLGARPRSPRESSR